MSLSVVIPTLNEAATLAECIACLANIEAEIVVADGGSVDATRQVAMSLGVHVVSGVRGRGCQLASGIAYASGDWLLILHADTRLQPGWEPEARDFMRISAGRAAHFRFALDSADPRARRLERAVAWRSRRLGLPYGDQGLLITRALLDAVGGMRPLVLMEDVDLVRRIGRRRLVALDAVALTSSIRWHRDGWYRRSARNLCCLALYYAGVPPSVIARIYS